MCTFWSHVRTAKVVRPEYPFLWQCHIPIQVSFFIWCLLHGFLALDDSLTCRGFHMVSCCICGSEKETKNHLFLHCSLSRQVWSHFFGMFGLRFPTLSSIFAMLLHWHRCSLSYNHIRVTIVCYIMWHIWKAHMRVGSECEITLEPKCTHVAHMGCICAIGVHMGNPYTLV